MSVASNGAEAAALGQFRRMMGVIGIAGVGMVALALAYLSATGTVTIHMVVATIAGVFLSVMLGCGLFAAAFFSDKSGHDDAVTRATTGSKMPNPTALPAGLASYRRTPEFTDVSVPAALRADHFTKEGSWGLIHVLEGQLIYRIADPRRLEEERTLVAGAAPGIVEPTILHHVELTGPVRFQVEFFRAG